MGNDRSTVGLKKQVLLSLRRFVCVRVRVWEVLGKVNGLLPFFSCFSSSFVFVYSSSAPTAFALSSFLGFVISSFTVYLFFFLSAL